jgi:sugar-specific transcriptional regulator TrmB
MNPQILQSIGLTKNESVVYLSLLELGTSKSGDILHKSGLNSGKIYEILDSLKKKGLASESIISNIRHFTASPPKQLLYYLQQKKNEIKNKESIIKNSIPQLEKLRETTIKEPIAVTYLGMKGLKTAADEALDSLKIDDEILAMGVSSLKNKKINEFWKAWSQKRIKKKIIAKHIFSEKSEYYNNFKKMNHTKAKILGGITPVTVDIFGEDIVLILSYKEPISCTLIKDKNTATSFKQFFNQLWKLSKS